MKNLYQNKTELDIIKMVTNSKGSTYGSFAMSTSSSSVPLGTVIVSIMHSNRIDLKETVYESMIESFLSK